MNNALTGVIATILALGTVGAMSQPGKPDKKAPPPAAAPALTPQQAEALRQAFDLPPGGEVEVEITSKDEGSIRVREEGRGVGAGAYTEGDKLNEQFTGSPPSVGLGEGRTAQGGGSQKDTEASAVKPLAQAWQNPMFWIGLALLGGAGFCVYSGLRRGATILGVAGGACLAVAFFPWLLLFGAAAAVAVFAGPYLYAEFQKRKAEQDAEKKKEALRAVVAGVEHKDVPPEVASVVKAAIAKEADQADRDQIDVVKRADKIGKYQD